MMEFKKHGDGCRVCRIESCAKRVLSSGLCSIHYQIRWRERPHRIKKHVKHMKCVIKGCLAKEQIRGFCRQHYSKNYSKYYRSVNRETLIKRAKEILPEKRLKYEANYRKGNPWAKVLKNAKLRCMNPRVNKFEYYGGRGVRCLLRIDQVKDLWNRDKASAMKQPSLDRINSNDHYSVDNCRFIEMSENRRRRRPQGTGLLPIG